MKYHIYKHGTFRTLCGLLRLREDQEWSASHVRVAKQTVAMENAHKKTNLSICNNCSRIKAKGKA